MVPADLVIGDERFSNGELMTVVLILLIVVVAFMAWNNRPRD